MRDPDNPNIQYRQASLTQIAVFILFIALLILGDLILILYFISVVSNRGFVAPAIIALIAAIVLLASLFVNNFVVSRIIKHKYDDRPKFYILLTFLSLNLPCGIMMLVRKAKEDDDDEDEDEEE